MPMPKGDGVEFVLYGLASLLCFVMAGCAFSLRPRDGGHVWKALVLALTLGLKSAEQYRPYPSGIHNPYTWAFCVLALVALGRYLQERRRNKAAQPVA